MKKLQSRQARRTINQQWLPLVEFAVVGFATCLNPQATFLIFLLKLCFHIFATLRAQE